MWTDMAVFFGAPRKMASVFLVFPSNQKGYCLETNQKEYLPSEKKGTSSEGWVFYWKKTNTFTWTDFLPIDIEPKNRSSPRQRSAVSLWASFLDCCQEPATWCGTPSSRKVTSVPYIWPMGQNPVPPVNIPITANIPTNMGGAPTPKWYHWF